MAEKLLQLLKAGTSAIMVVKEAEQQLKEAGFEELRFSNTWGLTEGGKYYMKHHDTTLLAFTVGQQVESQEGFKIAAAHTDFPCLRIKPNPDVVTSGYAQVNVEVYGGAILNTWLDRPLSISGRIAVKSNDVMHPDMQYIDIKRPLMTIPNLAIHMNREVNKGVELNRQTDMLPVVGLLEKELNEKQAFLKFLAKEEGVAVEDILDYELWVYCMQEPVTFGMNEELILSPRLDNLTSVQALLTGIIEGKQKKGINVIALFDHEEIGSKTKQGAGSLLLLNVLEKICDSFGKTTAQTKESIYESFLLSVDVAHGLHPNNAGKMDITNKPVLGGGLCIKEACSQSYATDCEAVAVVEQICQRAGVAYQKFVNRSDMAGGGTLGSIASSIIPIPTVDVGIPLLAMHSAAETMGKKDMESLTGLVREFFSL
ncbi:M18 family aminopeptidase [Roseburia sp. MSJ-14]|uniref:M18 family aminopeptidase n=1 Tax=Roseburia sp. MSJ-14 TaxID=2841514 RepID=UPI001C0FCC7B|nr:M18 family aminopeptidase [Roseburia sp. MSJ-14]MBU5473749.1 M18 family aminopeptidase [Roseburia sp. MSJ-14]